MSAIQGLLSIWPMGEIKSFPRAYISNTVASTPVGLYTLSTSKRAILLSVVISRQGGGDGFLQIGEGLGGAFTQRLPDLRYISGQTTPYDNGEQVGGLPFAFIFEANITMQATVAAVANNDVRVLPSVFEF